MMLPCTYTMLSCTYTMLPCTYTMLPCTYTMLPCTYTMLPCTYTMLPCTYTMLPCTYTILACTYTMLSCKGALKKTCFTKQNVSDTIRLRSVFLFWLLEIAIICQDVHRLELSKFFFNFVLHLHFAFAS